MRQQADISQMTPTARAVTAALLCGVALMLTYLESLLPLPLPLPGVKPGLAHVAVMVTYTLLGWKYALPVSLLRIGIVAVLFGNAGGFAFSLAGGLLSFAALPLCGLARGRISEVGASVASAAAHSVGQIWMASCLYGTVGVWYYLPVMLICAVPLGGVTGLLAALMAERLHLPRYGACSAR